MDWHRHANRGQVLFYILCINIYCSFSALFIVFDIDFVYIKIFSAHMDTTIFAQRAHQILF